MKPGDFLLGVFEFFAILLPGSFATWLAVQYIPDSALEKALTLGAGAPSNPDSVVVGIAFLASSYTLGHFVFMAGSRLDAWSYDRWRKRVKPANRDSTFKAAQQLHASLNKDLFGGSFTTLKWAKTYIQIKAQPARVEIDRLEADQKFFRSLVVISVLFAAHFLLREAAPVAGIASVVMGVLSHQRYLEQRWKMSELIYATAVIVHEASSASVGAPAGRYL
jgi:hypothetical protein